MTFLSQPAQIFAAAPRHHNVKSLCRTTLIATVPWNKLGFFVKVLNFAAYVLAMLVPGLTIVGAQTQVEHAQLTAMAGHEMNRADSGSSEKDQTVLLCPQHQTWGAHIRVTARTGDRIEITFHTMSMMAHPMHLHGHAFQVVGIGNNRFAGAVHDTLHVPPMRMVTVAVDAGEAAR